MSKYGLTVILCLLFAGGLIAGQTGAGLVTTAGVPGTPAVTTLDPTRAPEGQYVQAPQESYQQDAVTWSTRAAYPSSGTYRGLPGAYEVQTDSSFLYAIGGQGSYYSAECYRYNARTNTWTTLATHPSGGTSNQASAYWQDNGVGGDSSGVFTFATYGNMSNNNVYWWRKSTNTWYQVASIPGSWMYGNVACTIGDTCWVNTYYGFYGYCPRTNTWYSRASAPASYVYFGAMAASQGKAYLVGGWGITSVYAYNPATGTWATKASLPGGIGGNSPNAVPWDTGAVHRLYVWCGGNYWTAQNGVAWYDAGSDVWTSDGTCPEGIIGAFYGFIKEFPGPIIGINHCAGYNGSSYITTHRRGVPDVPQPNDVGVSKIISPSDPFYAFGDTIKWVVAIKNYGTSPQTNVPVRAVLYPKGHASVFDYTENYTGTIGVGKTCTLAFTHVYAPPAQETIYVDSVMTKLVGDANPTNDAMTNNLPVTQWGSQCMTYNDGTFDNAISWVSAGNEMAERFFAPVVPLAVNKAQIYLSSFSGADYAAEVRIYGNDGSPYGNPGTQLGSWVGNLHTSIWTSLYLNDVYFSPAINVTFDTFFVSYYQTSITPAYPYMGMDYSQPITTGNDWGKYGGTWGIFPYDTYMDFGINGCFQALLLDGTITDIPSPAATVDSNVSFTPQVVVKNAGLKARTNIPVEFNIVNNVTGDTVCKKFANSGPVAVGASKTVTFTDTLLNPGTYTMTGISLMPYDGKPSNDTLKMPLFVRYYDVKVAILSPRTHEVPGRVPVTVKLTNVGNVPAMVPRLDVTINPAGYADYRQNIAIPVGGSQVVTLNPWVCPAASYETCMAWITDPADMNHGHLNDGVWNDTAKNSVATGVPGWTELTPLPAPPSGKMIKDGGWLAYDAGSDLIYGSKGNKTMDFYAYNVNGGTWTTLTTIPLGAEGKEVYTGSVGCADGNGMLYMTKGNNTVGFWSYNTATKAWTQLTNVPTGSSGKKVKAGAGIAWATKHGTGAAYLLKGYRNEFYKYDPATNSWTNLLDAPIGSANHLKYNAGSWMVSNAETGAHMLYVFKSQYHEFYTYDTDNDTWSHAKNPMPIPGSAGNKKAKDGSSAAWYSAKIYAFKGGNTNEFWRYFPLGDSWKKQDDIPLIGMTGLRKKVKAGGALAGYPGLGVYGFKGNKSLEFWRFTPYDVVAGTEPNRDGITASSTQIGSVSFAIAPNPLSGGFATVRYNLPMAGLATLNVFDVTGRTVLMQTLAAGRTGTASLDLRKLDAGVYLVKVATEGFSTTQKLVVEH